MGNDSLDRRSFLKKTGAIAGVGAAGFFGIQQLLDFLSGNEKKMPPAPGMRNPFPLKKIMNFSGRQPNIVIINCDDLGYGDLGCYGNKAIRTPKTDQLSREGVRFTDFYASCSVCTPSRFGLLTGRYPARSGLIFVLSPLKEAFYRKYIIRGVGGWFGRIGAVDTQDESYEDGISDDEVTIAESLRFAGYRTGMVGKWHLGDFTIKPEYNPVRHGFDEFFGVPYSNDMSPFPLYRNENKLIADMTSEQEKLTGLYTKESVDFINRSKSKPFFLYLAHTFPHQPIYASEKFKDKSKAGIFGDSVEEIDWSVGEITDCLRKNGLEKDTILIFTSDNGPWYNGSAGNLRGRKGQSYEGGFGVPFIVKWPGHIPEGSICKEPAMNIDLFPTLLSLAGFEIPSDRIIDGKNIYGLITGAEKKTPHEELYFYHYEELEGIRAGNWKYFRNVNHYVWPQPVDKPTHFLGKLGKGNFGDWPNLYNLEFDREECYNLSAKYPDIVRKMEKRMNDWEAGIKNNPRGWLNK